MTNTEFAQFQRTYGCGNADQYISNKRINEEIHINKEFKRKNEKLEVRNWERRSEHFIESHHYDVGRGRFIYLERLNKEINHYKI